MKTYDVGEIAAAIRCNLYRHATDIPSYPVGIVEAVLQPLIEEWTNEMEQMTEHAREGWEYAHAHMYRCDALGDLLKAALVENERLEAELAEGEPRFG